MPTLFDFRLPHYSTNPKIYINSVLKSKLCYRPDRLNYLHK